MTNLDELKELNQKLTSLLNDSQPGLITWREALAKTLNSISEFCPTDSPSILATAHSDDWVVEVSFDAGQWFRQASDDEIIDLISCGFSGDYPSDAVAMYMATFSPDLKKMFTYSQEIKNIGFECAVNIEQAVKWLKQEKAHLRKYLDDAKVEGLI